MQRRDIVASDLQFLQLGCITLTHIQLFKLVLVKGEQSQLAPFCAFPIYFLDAALAKHQLLDVRVVR